MGKKITNESSRLFQINHMSPYVTLAPWILKSLYVQMHTHIYMYIKIWNLYMYECVCVCWFIIVHLYITSHHIRTHCITSLRSHQRRLMDGWTDEGYNNKTNQTSFHSIPCHAIQCTPQNKSQGRIRYSGRKWMSEIESVWKTFAL